MRRIVVSELIEFFEEILSELTACDGGSNTLSRPHSKIRHEIRLTIQALKELEKQNGKGR
jgi:hypothetical protein